MTSAALTVPLHGGDLGAATRRWGTPSAGWLDLSTGINPHSYPLPPLPPDLWRRLPEPQALETLLEAAGRTYGLPDPACIAAGAGSEMLISLLPRLFPAGQTVVIHAPTYSGHGRAWAAAGHRVILLNLFTTPLPADVRFLIIVNPNNPDGSLMELSALQQFAAQMHARDGLLIVDEAFGEVMPSENSAISTPLPPGLLVLRSFGKFYGLAGVRLGFALSAPDLICRLRDLPGSWPVSAPALAIGTAALQDSLWREKMVQTLQAEGAALRQVLRDLPGSERVSGTSLFQLLIHPAAEKIYDQLGQSGILVRAFAEDPTRLRIGLPGSPENLERLSAALQLATTEAA